MLLVLVAAALLIRPDLESLRPPIERRLSATLGRQVEIGSIELVLLPIVRVSADRIRIAGETAGDAPLLDLPRADVSVHPWPLLWHRRVELTVALRGPEIRLGPDLVPVLPIPGAAGAAGAVPEAGAAPEGSDVLPGAAGGDGGGDTGAERDGAPPVVLRGLRISDGRLHWRGITAEGIDASARLEASGAAGVKVSAEIPGLGRLDGVEAHLSGPGEPGPGALDGRDLEVSGRVEDLDLGAVDRLLELGLGLAGGLSADLGAELHGTRVERADLEGELRQVALEAGALHLDGPVDLEAAAPEGFRIDLTRAEIRAAGTVRKRRGVPLVIDGALPDELPPPTLPRVGLHLGETHVPLSIRLSPGTRVEVRPAAFEVAPLLSLLEGEPPAIDGSVRVERGLAVVPSPLSVDGDASLEGVTLPVGAGRGRVSGPLVAEGRRISSPGLDVDLEGQRVVVEPVLELPNGALTVGVSTDGTDVETLGRVLAGRTDLTGSLGLQARFGGVASEIAKAPLASLAGQGRLSILEGRLRGVSLAREVLGELVALPLLVARLRGKDLSRYEEQEFEELSADFRIRDAVLRTENLTVRYRYSTARLRGSVGLSDGALDLSGTLTLAREVDQDLGGSTAPEERVIPISGVRGTVSRPRVTVDREALAEVARAYVTGGRLRRKLEERLGTEGAEAVEGVLDRILKGERGR